MKSKIRAVNKINVIERRVHMINITSPLPGKILEIKVAIGDNVTAGQELILIESMKMEMPIVSDVNGTVKRINVNENDAVQSESVLMEIE